jgi:hypothetical protein
MLLDPESLFVAERVTGDLAAKRGMSLDELVLRCGERSVFEEDLVRNADLPDVVDRAASASCATGTGGHPAASASRRAKIATRSEWFSFGESLASIERARDRIEIRDCERCRRSARSLSESS